MIKHRCSLPRCWRWRGSAQWSVAVAADLFDIDRLEQRGSGDRVRGLRADIQQMADASIRAQLSSRACRSGTADRRHRASSSRSPKNRCARWRVRATLPDQMLKDFDKDRARRSG